MLTVLSIPVLGTVLGASMVFFMKKKMNEKFMKALLGFASGVMVAASMFSLLIPALSDPLSNVYVITIGFLSVSVFVLLIDTFTPHIHAGGNKKEGVSLNVSKTLMMFLALAIHNIPEGFATGIVFTNTGELNASLPLIIGIAIQNFPEGAIISLPLYDQGNSKLKSFLVGAASGLVEPIAAVLAFVMAGIFTSILPFTLAFAAGAMLYVVVEELIPESQSGEHSNVGSVSFTLGFVVMMLLDVLLG